MRVEGELNGTVVGNKGLRLINSTAVEIEMATFAAGRF